MFHSSIDQQKNTKSELTISRVRFPAIFIFQRKITFVIALVFLYTNFPLIIKNSKFFLSVVDPY